MTVHEIRLPEEERVTNGTFLVYPYFQEWTVIGNPQVWSVNGTRSAVLGGGTVDSISQMINLTDVSELTFDSGFWSYSGDSLSGYVSIDGDIYEFPRTTWYTIEPQSIDVSGYIGTLEVVFYTEVTGLYWVVTNISAIGNPRLPIDYWVSPVWDFDEDCACTRLHYQGHSRVVTTHLLATDSLHYMSHSLMNGDFESGDLSYWAATAYSGDIVEAATVAAHSGTYGCRLYNEDVDETGSTCELRQTITTNFTSLGFWYKIETAQAQNGYDWLQFYVQMTGGYVDNPEYGERWIDVYSIQNPTVGEWTHIQVVKDTLIDPEYYCWYQVTNLVIAAYACECNPEATPAILEVFIDDVEVGDWPVLPLTYMVVHTVLNGDFETGDLTNWISDVSVWEPATIVTEVNEISAHSGTYGIECRITTDVSDAGGYSYPSQDYITSAFDQLEFWYKINTCDGASEGNTYLILNINGYAIFVLYPTEASDWTYFVISKDIEIVTGPLLPSNQIEFQICNYNTTEGSSDFQVFIDDVAVRCIGDIECSLEYTITPVVLMEYDSQYCISITPSPLQSVLAYSIRPLWCNGGFELGDLTCWTETCDEGSTFNVVGEAAHSGSYGCALVSISNGYYNGYLELYQEYFSNQWDTLSFWYKVHDVVGGGARLRVQMSYLYWPSWDPGHSYWDMWIVYADEDLVTDDWIYVTIDRATVEDDLDANLGVGRWTWDATISLYVTQYIYNGGS
jgi:hypothetical protein